MKYFIVYDGRASYDVNAAALIDFIEAKDKSEAKRKFKQIYDGYDYVLFDNEDNPVW